jgi:hypothetical protein
MRALVISMSLLFTACGAVERAFVAGLMEVQSRAVLTQSTFKSDQPVRRHKPCDGIRSARLNFADAFSKATTSVSSTMASSSKCVRIRAKSASETSRPVIVMLSAYSSAARSRSSKSADVAYSLIARSLSSEIPSALPTAAFRSCQNSQPLRKATRRLIIAWSAASTRPEESRPLHIILTPRKMDGRRA